MKRFLFLLMLLSASAFTAEGVVEQQSQGHQGVISYGAQGAVLTVTTSGTAAGWQQPVTSVTSVTASSPLSSSGGTSPNITLGTVGVGNGGTGQTTANAGLNALLPVQTGSPNYYLKTDGTNTSWAAVVIPSTAFSSITNGTNTGASMLVGTGASLGTTGTGTIQSTSCTGNAATATTASATPFSGVTTGTNNTALTIGTGGSLGVSGSGTITATSCSGNSATATTASAVPFNGLTSGTVTGMAGVIGNGSSLSATGTGTITATNSPAVGGITITGTPAAGNQPIASSSSAASWGALNLAGGANYITGTLPSGNGGTGSTYFGISGPTALRTYTLPDANSTLLYSGGALGTPSSGTVTNLTGTASININGTVGATTPTTGAFTHLTAEGVTSTGATGTGSLVFATSPTLVTPALGTPSSGTLTNCTFPTFNQSTTGSAASLSISGQTGLLSMTGLASTNRVKTVRDAADTLLELGGSYTPTGTWNWTSATATWPTFNQSTTGTATNATNAANTGITNNTISAATWYPTFVSANTGNLPQTVNSSALTFVPSTGVLSSTGFAGALTGNVTGNVSGSSGSCTGNAATATTATTASALTSAAPVLIYPSSDSTIAVQIDNAAKSTTVFNVDTTNGRVGIGGNTSPSYLLDVNGTARIGSTSSNINSIYIPTSGNAISHQICSATSQHLLMLEGGYYNESGYTATSTSSSQMLMYAGNTYFFGNTGLTAGTNYIVANPTLVITPGSGTAAGSVGICNTSPSYPLDVNGTARIGNTSSNFNSIYIPTSGNAISHQICSANSQNLLMLEGGYYNGSGYTATSTSSSQMQMSAGNTYFYGNTGLTAGTNYTVANSTLVITPGSGTAAGSVGICNASPSYPLDVTGSIHTSASICVPAPGALTVTSNSCTPALTSGSLNNVFRVTATHGQTLTINAPTGLSDGQYMEIDIVQDSSGSGLWALGTGNTTAGTMTSPFVTTGAISALPTLSTTANARDMALFYYASSSGKWNFVSFISGGQ